MATLHWVFTNGHKWHKQFDNVALAETYAHQCGVFADPNVARAWIDTDTEQIWLKEKHTV